jgi:hypothetical protein
LPKLSAAAAVSVLLLLAPTRTLSADDDFAATEAAATAGAGTADGKKFQDTLEQAFGRDHASTIQKCAKAEKRPDLSDFELLLRVNASGAVDQALVKPVTALAACVRDKMPGWKIGAPPQAGYWVKVGVNLKPTR